MRLVATSERWLTNGVQGIPGIPKMFAMLTGTPQALAVLGLLVALNLLAVFAMLRIVRSPFGRMIEAIRDNEEAVKALGKDPAGFKIQVLVLGAVSPASAVPSMPIISATSRPSSSCRS